jgi:hypothetical protein
VRRVGKAESRRKVALGVIYLEDIRGSDAVLQGNDSKWVMCVDTRILERILSVGQIVPAQACVDGQGRIDLNIVLTKEA